MTGGLYFYIRVICDICVTWIYNFCVICDICVT